MHGKGKLTLANGEYIEGIFKNGFMVGEGTWYKPGIGVYHGGF